MEELWQVDCRVCVCEGSIKLWWWREWCRPNRSVWCRECHRLSVW